MNVAEDLIGQVASDLVGKAWHGGLPRVTTKGQGWSDVGAEEVWGHCKDCFSFIFLFIFFLVFFFFLTTDSHISEQNKTKRLVDFLKGS